MEDHTVHIHQYLIDRCRAGDRQAFFQLYRLYSKSMYNIGYRIVHDEAEAHDVLQDAFISAFNSLHRYRGDSTFGAWLKTIVVNKAINALKKRRFERIPESDQFDVAEPVEDALAEFPYTVDQVKQAIGELPEGYRLVLSLYLLEGYDHAEIGDILGITESTSKSQFNRSKKKLRELLAEKTRGNTGL
ncbi:MAG: sigma-70 family RNA polymerase sigma factor [Cyclobacteriaceae bacterium]|nr:sigma-70 family RNA polymerase sigma factor [Cyclobacteriaceae bacterium]